MYLYRRLEIKFSEATKVCKKKNLSGVLSTDTGHSVSAASIDIALFINSD